MLLRAVACLSVLLCLPFVVVSRGFARAAPALTPAGRWVAVDDRTGKTKGIVDLYVDGDRLTGRIEKNLDPAYANIKELLCISCSGALKDKPILGLELLWGMKRSGGAWTGGYILDPESGNIYRCTMTLEADGQKLKVRGYIGFPIFGRTLHWHRAE
jgi:hypothetical protein